MPMPHQALQPMHACMGTRARACVHMRTRACACCLMPTLDRKPHILGSAASMKMAQREMGPAFRTAPACVSHDARRTVHRATDNAPRVACGVCMCTSARMCVCECARACLAAARSNKRNASTISAGSPIPTFVCVHTCRARLHMSSMRASVDACKCACVRACVRACVHASACTCARRRVPGSNAQERLARAVRPRAQPGIKARVILSAPTDDQCHRRHRPAATSPARPAHPAAQV